MAWVSAVGRKNITFFSATASVKVCSRHFHSGKPAYEMLEFDPDWAPSLHLGHNELKSTAERFARRSQTDTDMAPTEMDEVSGPAAPVISDIANMCPTELGMSIKVKEEEEEDFIDQLLIDDIPSALKEEDLLDAPEPVHTAEDSKLWVEKTKARPPLQLSLYQAAGELGSYFLDEDLTTAVKIHVVGSAGGMETKQDAVGLCDREFEEAVPTVSTREGGRPANHRPRGRAEDGPLLEFLRESEAASQTRHEEILSQMKSSQETFQAMMTAILEKI